MIISHKLKYIFIHVPKCAGTSITNILRNNKHFQFDYQGHWQGIKEEEYDVCPRVLKELYTHSTAIAIKEFLENNGYNWDDYFKFAFIRNPWDRMVSEYEYYMQILSKQENLYKNNKKILEKYNNKPPKDFLINHCDDFAKSHLCDLDGNVMIDFVGKFENIKEDMKTIVKKINPNLSEDDWELPHVNATKKIKNYRKYYDDESIEAVRKKSQKTIELGIYKFYKYKYIN